MRINRIKLRNYRKFRYAELEFGDGIISINGLNGAGKSTLMEAITWALYGNDKRVLRDGKTGVKYSGASPSDTCSVELEFEIAGDTYLLRREMRGKSGTMVAEISQNGIPQASTDGKVKEFIEKRLGMDAEGFLISVFARQKELNALSELRPEDRKRKIESMLGLDVIDDARKMIAQDRNSIKKEIEGMRRALYDENGMPVVDKRKKELDERVKDVERFEKELKIAEKERENVEKEWKSVESLLNELREKEKRHLKLLSEVERLKKAIEDRKRDMERKEKELNELKEKRELLDKMRDIPERLGELEERKEKMEEGRERYRKILEIERDMERVKGEIERLRKGVETRGSDLKGMKEQMKDRGELEKKREEIRKEIDAVRESITEIKSEINSIKKELRSLEKSADEMERLGPESKCPTCHRPLGDDYPHILEEIREEMEEGRKRLVDAEEKLKENENKEKSLREEMEKVEKDIRAMDRLESSISNLESSISEKRKEIEEKESELKRLMDERNAIGKADFDEREYESLRKEIRELREKEKEYEVLKAKVERIPAIESEIERMRDEIERNKSTIETLEEEIKRIDFSEKELKDAEMRFKEMSERRKEIHGRIEALKAKIDAGRREIEEMKVEIERLEKQMDELEKFEEEIRYLSALDSLMKDFRTHSISGIRPALENIASEFFSRMTDGKYIVMEIDEDYKVKIIDSGKAYPIERFSGGESDLANLCLRLAISEVVVRARGAKGFNFLVLDEIFGSQDQGRRENILRALQSLQNRFSQIFLISHIEGTKESANMVINVEEKEDGTSEVRVE